MKNKKLFINGLSSFLIIGGFLSSSYSVFAMKGSPKKKKMTSKRITKDQKLTEFDSNMDPSKKENNNSKQVFLKLKEMNDHTFNRYAELFKDKNFGELVLSEDSFQSLEESFHITERIQNFNDLDSFLKWFIDNATTVIQDYNLLVDFLKRLSKNQKHILLFPSHWGNDNDDLIPQEISIELFLANLTELINSVSTNSQEQNLFGQQLLKTKLLFFIYATGLYFFFQINTIKQEDLLQSQLRRIPIFIHYLSFCLNIDKLFNTDLKLKSEWIPEFCNLAVIINRLDQNEQRLLKNISQHLEARYTNFLAQYDLKNIDIPSLQFSKKLKQLLSSEKSQELLNQFLCDITYPLFSLLRHFRNSGFGCFAGKDTDGKYVGMNLLKNLPLFEKRAGFLTEALSPNCVKDDSFITKTIAAMEEILRFIPVTFRIIESEEQCQQDIDPNQNFSFYQFSENAEISKEYPNLTTSIKGCFAEKINDFLKTIKVEEWPDLRLKIHSLSDEGYINCNSYLYRSLHDLQYTSKMLDQDASYYVFSFPSINDFTTYLDNVSKSFLKFKKDFDIVKSLVVSLKQITHWQSQYQSIPSDRKAFFADIHSNISSINEKLKTCLNQLGDENFLINEEWINNIIDQQEKLDETIQAFEAKTKLMDEVSTWLNKLRNLVGILGYTNTNIAKNTKRPKKATKKGKVQTKTNHQLSVPISSSSDLGNIKGKLDNILKRINTLETKFFNCDLNEEEFKEEVSSVKRELDGIAQGLRNAKVKKLYMQDQSLDQSLNAQNEVVKYDKNQIFFVNSNVKKEAVNYISRNGIYQTDMNKFVQSLSDGSVNSHSFHTHTLFFQKFSKDEIEIINKCIKDFNIQYVCYKEQNGQNSSLRILYGIDKKKNNVIIFYVGAPFHKGSKASTLSSKNFTDFALQPL